jgi:hypothetical protein
LRFVVAEIQVDSLGDHLCTCTVYSGVMKGHDWTVDQLVDLFRTTHKVKTQQVVKSRGQYCGDIELGGYLANVQVRYLWCCSSVLPTIGLSTVLTLL